MIYPSLTDAQMKRSQRFFIGFNLLNGIGYMCVGNMVMDLLAINMKLPDVVLTTLGALFNVGYVCLPLGKIATEKWGAARTQSNFWFLRNFASIMMGSCAIWGYYGHPTIAIVFLLGGAFIFYGCRSAGSVMSNSLVGNITREKDRGKLLAFASMSHNIMTAVVMIALTGLLGYVERLGGGKSIWALFGIVVFGAFCGIMSAVCLRFIDESDAIMKAAKKPLIADAWYCLKDSAFRRMVTGQVCNSLGFSLTFALNTLVLKRGLHVPDSWFLALSFLGSFLYVIWARPAAWLGDKIGPRKAMIFGYCFMFLVILFWMVVPENYTWYNVSYIPFEISPWLIVAAAVLFCLTSCCSMFTGICDGQYFLKCIPVDHQPSAATLQSLINGVLTGFIAMGMTAGLWWMCDHIGGNADIVQWLSGNLGDCAPVRWICDIISKGGNEGLARYRLFFLLGLPLVALFSIGPCMRKEV